MDLCLPGIRYSDTRGELMKKKYAAVLAGVMAVSLFSGCAMENGKFVTTANAGERQVVEQAGDTQNVQKEEGGFLSALKSIGSKPEGDGQANGGQAADGVVQGSSGAQSAEGTQGSAAGENAGASSSSVQSNSSAEGQNGNIGATENQNTELQGTGALDVNAFAAELLQDFSYGTGWGAGCSGVTLKAYEAAVSLMTTANTYGVRNADNTQLANACVSAFSSLGREARENFAANWSLIVTSGDSILNNPGAAQGELEDSGSLGAAQNIICTESSPQNWAVLKSLIQVNCIG